MSDAATETDWADVRAGMHVVPMELIFESAENARKYFDPAKIDELAELIASCGGINNDAGKARRNVLMDEFDGFELIDGARRFRALKKLGATHMKLEIVGVDEGKATRQMAMMTRLGKVDLSPMELCAEYHRMIECGDYGSVKDLAAGTGQSGHERLIHAVMSLNKLVPDVAEALESGEITREHAIKIAAEKQADQVRLLAMCFDMETVTIGALPETHKRLITTKALAGIIQSQFRDVVSDKKETLKQAKHAREKDRDQATSLETSATTMLDGATDEGDHDDAGDDPDDGRQQRQTSNNANKREKGNDGEGGDDRQDHDQLLAKSDREIVSALTAAVRFSFQSECRPGTRIDQKIKELLDELLQSRRLTRAFDGYLQEHFNKSKTSKGRWDEFAVDLLDELLERRAGCTPRPDSVEASYVRVRDFVVTHFENDILPGEWPSDAAIRLLDELAIGRKNVAGQMAQYDVESEKTARKPKSRVSGLFKFDRKKISELIVDAADYVENSMEIPTEDLALLRRMGISDASLANLMEAILGTETRGPIELDEYKLFYSHNRLTLTYKNDHDMATVNSEEIIPLMRQSMMVPQPIETAELPPKKEDPAGAKIQSKLVAFFVIFEPNFSFKNGVGVMRCVFCF